MPFPKTKVLLKNRLEGHEEFAGASEKYNWDFIYVLMEIVSKNRQMAAPKQSEAILQNIQTILAQIRKPRRCMQFNIVIPGNALVLQL